MVLAEIVPVFEAGETGEGVESMDGGKVGVGNLSEEAFERGDAEGYARGVEDRGIQFFEVVAAPIFSATALPFCFDEAEAFFDM